MGKWSGLKDKFTAFVQDPTYQQKVDLEKKTLAKLSRVLRCAKYAAFKRLKEAAEDEIEKLNVKLEALSQLLVDDLEGEAETKITNDTGTFSIKDEPYPSVKDKLAFHAWVRSSGQEEILTVNYMTMSAIVKAKIEAGEEIPPGVDVFIKTSIRWTKPRE
jgi:hypothetical protein